MCYFFVMVSPDELAEREVEELMLYLKTLKRGFDKEDFELRIESLAQSVDTYGLSNDNFHKLLKIWLNLTIRKYSCLVMSLLRVIIILC